MKVLVINCSPVRNGATAEIPNKVKEDFKEYQITLKLMKKANQGAILNPCPPFFRGEEVTEDVIDSECFVGYGFKKCSSICVC